MYDYLIVGCGFFGSIFAREATDSGKKCLIIDRRNHIGGNAYSYKDSGIDIHKYGPHIFHTNNKPLWDYVNRFDNFIPYFNQGKVYYNNKLYSFPINLLTFNQLWGVTIPEQAKELIEQKKINIPNPQNLEEYVLSMVGQEIYETFIRGYTKKQWGRDPKELPISIIKRIPIRYNFRDFSTDDIYSGIPENGYDTVFTNILKDIDVQLNTDYFNNRNQLNSLAKKVVFTGCIDQYFDYEFGSLQYRSVRFENEVHAIEDYQGNALINYTNEEIPYTRICEHKHFLPHKKVNGITIISKEFSQEWKPGIEPYYPINDDKNNNIFKKYLDKSKQYKNVLFGGRLSEYKYYDMHQVIASSLSFSKKELA